MKPEINLEYGWRLLRDGEVIKDGDQVYFPQFKAWALTNDAGRVYKDNPYVMRRRRIATVEEPNKYPGCNEIVQKLEVAEKKLNAIYSLATNLTKREYFAGLALQGLLADIDRLGSCETHAKSAVQLADALLAELKKGHS